ncbi:MAG TPA: HAD-IC family P-type ATPase [Acidimicrobiia bacterium]|nr:HAD-IC family P-type ATPase [Acidimicrobiia bacterium]
MGLFDFVRPVARAVSTRTRRSWVNEERAHLELRRLDPAELAGFAAELEAALTGLAGVQWVDVNGYLGRAVVAFDPAAVSVADLVAEVEAVEAACGVADRPFPSETETHPGDVEPLLREAAKLGADAVSLAVAFPVRFLAPLTGGVRTVAGSAVAVINGVPKVRGAIEERFPSPLTDVSLAVVNTLVQGIGSGPLAPLTELTHHLSTLLELRAGRAAWAAREPELYSKPANGGLPALVAPRPGPLPAGPVEAFADRAWTASLAAAGAMLVTTRNPAVAGRALEAGVPKAARYGKEAFAATIGRALSGRGVVVVHRAALRALDRVDCLVLQGDLLVTDDLVPAEIAPVGGADPAELRRAVTAVLDPARPTADAERDGWRLGPLDRLGIEPTGRIRQRAAELAGPGVPVLGLARESGPGALGGVPRVQLRALVQLRPALWPEADDLVALARAGNLEVVFALRGDAPVIPLEADRVVPDGAGLAEAVRGLQGEGRVVCLVGGASSSDGLWAADCGIGIHEAGDAAPWGADIIATGLHDAAFLVEACEGARAASRWSARTATLGASLAAFLAFRPLPGTGLRVGTAVNGAALVTMAGTTRAAMALAQRPRPLPRDPTPWHALDPRAALERTGSSLDGLDPAEAARRRPARQGAVPAPLRLARDMADELVNPLTPILAVGAGLSLVTGAPVDAAMVGGVVALNAVIGGVQQFRADEAFAALERVGARRAIVRRGGEESVVDAESLVPGDVVRLRAGDAVPADLRILSTEWLEVDESSLTGESLPVTKDAEPTFALTLADRTSMLYDGSSVAAGEALAVVVATGSATEARRAVAAGQQAPATGVEARLQHLTALTVPISIGAGAVTVAAGLLRRQPFGQLAAGAVSLAVAAVPEGLPLLSSVAQLSAARRLARHGILVRNPRAIEALGRVQVMCVDKTGTVTEGRLSLNCVAFLEGTEEVLDDLSELGRKLLRAGLRATPKPPPAGRLPHPTDAAVADAGLRAGIDARHGYDDWERIDEMPFEPGRGFHATLAQRAGELILSVKGAPEIVLPRCTHWADGSNGAPVPMTDDARARATETLQTLTRRGLRVLCVARRPATERRDLDDERVQNLIFLGFLAIADPVRPTAAEAVRHLQAAGVSVVMITGDHPSTAEGIASELGLLNGHPTVTGAELDELDDEELTERLPGVSVFARVTPAHKVRIVRALQQAGSVVAMTGDGANDAPAIRLADVGIALGRRSTEAARDAADLVVLDDRIEVLVDAVAEGRGMWVSVRDAVALLVGGNLGEIGFTVGGTLLGGQTPLNPRQLLLVNMLTDVAPAMAIAVQPPSRISFTDLLREGPEASLGSALDQAIVQRAICTGAAATGAWVVGRFTGTPARARTIGLAALVGTQLGQTLAAGRPSPATVASVVGSGAVLVVVIQTPGVSQLFGCTPLDPVGWGTAAVAAAAGTGAALVLPRLWAARSTR